MKKTAWILLTLLLVFASGSALADRSNGVWRYKVSHEQVTLTSYDGSERIKKLEFPSELDGYPVTKIGEGSIFVWLNEVGQRTELVLPDTATEINGGFFTLGSFGKIVIPASVVKLGDSSLSNASLTAVEFKGAPEKIGRYAFADNFNMKSIVIPEGTRTIGDSCFEGCEAMTSAELPASLTSIGEKLFSGCVRLSSVKFNRNCEIKDIPMGSFISCALQSIVLPDKVEKIGTNAFYDCKKLTSVTIPAGVTQIASDAFAGCSSRLTLTVTEGSYAHQWAQEKGYKFKTVPAPAEIPEGAADGYTELRPGSKGQAVLDARMKLYELGYFKKKPTQLEYTNNMKDYVKAFEKDYGLETDGILSPEDLAVLFAQ